jgi:hypothetical protein
MISHIVYIYFSSTCKMFMTVHKNIILCLKVRYIYALYENLSKQNTHYNKRRQTRK